MIGTLVITPKCRAAMPFESIREGDCQAATLIAGSLGCHRRIEEMTLFDLARFSRYSSVGNENDKGAENRVGDRPRRVLALPRPSSRNSGRAPRRR